MAHQGHTHSHPHAHDHGHDHAHGRSHGPGGHSHGPEAAHPPQPAAWSILRMTLAARLAAAVAISAGLWAVVVVAMY